MNDEEYTLDHIHFLIDKNKFLCDRAQKTFMAEVVADMMREHDRILLNERLPQSLKNKKIHQLKETKEFYDQMSMIIAEQQNMMSMLFLCLMASEGHFNSIMKSLEDRILGKY